QGDERTDVAAMGVEEGYDRRLAAKVVVADDGAVGVGEPERRRRQPVHLGPAQLAAAAGEGGEQRHDEEETKHSPNVRAPGTSGRPAAPAGARARRPRRSRVRRSSVRGRRTTARTGGVEGNRPGATARPGRVPTRREWSPREAGSRTSRPLYT